MRTRKQHFVLHGIAVLTVLALAGFSASGEVEEHHARGELVPVEGSSVGGQVNLVQLPQGGTLISIVASGLKPGGTYVSLYYSNHDCGFDALDMGIVGGTYTPDGVIGHVVGRIDDDLDEVNSISVRNADDLSLLACADVHPAE